MTIDTNEIRTAVDLLSKEDPEQWADGKPVLLAVQRVMSNDAVTQADLDAVFAPAAPVVPVAPAVVARTAEPGPGTGGATSDDDRPEGIGPSEDRTAIILAEVEALKQTKAGLLPELTALEKEREALDARLAAAQKAVVDIDIKVEEATAQISDAEMVKRIQKQTRDRLMAQHAQSVKVAEAMNGAGIKTYASELDKALANGTKRSKLIGADGKLHEAPHPRSPEGVKSYANWVHHGAGQPA